MPNWCSTYYEIDGEKTVKEIKDILAYLEDNPAYKHTNGFGNLWLGNVLALLGYKNGESCRGQITWYEDTAHTVNLSAETAWSVQPSAILALVKEAGGEPSDIRYEAEECGCELYIYDGFEKGWYVDIADICDRDFSTKELRSFLTERLAKEGVSFGADDSVEDLISIYRKAHETDDNFYGIYRWEREPLTEMGTVPGKANDMKLYRLRYMKDGKEHETIMGLSERQVRIYDAEEGRTVEVSSEVELVKQRLEKAGYSVEVSQISNEKGRSAWEYVKQEAARGKKKERSLKEWADLM